MFCCFRSRDLSVLRLRKGGAEDKGERKGRAKCLSSAGGGEQGWQAWGVRRCRGWSRHGGSEDQGSPFPSRSSKSFTKNNE